MTFGRFAALLLFACALFGFYNCLLAIIKRKRENAYFACLAFCSALWSSSFGFMFWQTNVHTAYLWRCAGMIGIFGYIIFMTVLVARFLDVPQRLKQLAIVFSFVGILICPLTMMPESVEFVVTQRGMTYLLPVNFTNVAYYSHSGILLFLFLGATIYVILRERKTGIRIVAVGMMIACIIITLGTVLDIILPMCGVTAIPGSCVCQSLGTLMMYIALKFRENSVLTPENMSNYIYHSLGTPIYICDEELQVQFVNKAGYEFLHMNEEQCLTLNMRDIFHIEEELQQEKRIQLKETVCLKNHVICDVNINSIKDRFGDLLGYIAIADDLSDKIQYMEELKESKRQAEAANMAKSMFLANMSHEIRTPMHAIVGFSELILKENISPEVRKNIGHIKNSSNNLLSIINDILDFSKIESGKMEIVEVPYYISTLLKDVIAIISNQATTKGLEFEVDIDEKLPQKLQGDKVRIRSILINVLNNAVKYTTKGTIHFNVDFSYLEEDVIECAFTVTDTGVGMHPEEMEQLFQAFERLDQTVHYGVEGSGLGLAICNTYVEMMGGRIEVESTYGEGSVFRVLLPQRVLKHEPIDMEFVYQDVHSEGKMRIRNQEILVVDDNMINRMVAEGILEGYGGHVDMADGGQAAIDACKKKKYDLIFMDHMMPEVDGTMAQKEIRKISQYYREEVTIIVLTAEAIAGMKEHFLAEGFDEYLSKPIEVGKLEHMFKRFVPEDCIYYE